MARQRRFSKWRLVGALAALGAVAGALLVPATSGAAATPKFKGEIKLGMMLPIQYQFFSVPDAPKAAQAAMDRINKAGGVNGNKLTLDYCDDKGDAATAQACATKLVNTDKVAALIGSVGTNNAILWNAAKPANTIQLCNTPVATDDWLSPLSYPCQMGIFGYVNEGLVLNKTYKKITVTSADIASTDLLYGFLKQSYTGVGADQVPIVKWPASQTEFDTVMTSVKSGDPNAWTPTVGANTMINMIKSAINVGFVKPLYTYTCCLTQDIVKYAAQKKYPTSAIGSFSLDPKNPTRQQLLKDFKKAGIKDNIQDASISAWLGVQIFADMAKGISGTIDANSVSAYFKANPVIQTGLTPTLDFSKTGPITTPFPMPRLVMPWNIATKVTTKGLVQVGDFKSLVPGAAAPGPVTQPKKSS
jgi:ABC-type branched-subunit amino acid transport system substrate-binding protein